MILAPDQAEKYNGQQEDIWDPQRDMMLGMIGAVISMAVTAVWERRRSSTKR